MVIVAEYKIDACWVPKAWSRALGLSVFRLLAPSQMQREQRQAETPTWWGVGRGRGLSGCLMKSGMLVTQATTCIKYEMKAWLVVQQRRIGPLGHKIEKGMIAAK